jgi:hypothetical protein
MYSIDMATGRVYVDEELNPKDGHWEAMQMDEFRRRLLWGTQPCQKGQLEPI